MKIEKNIPIPTARHSYAKYSVLLDEMEVGDSIAVETLTARNSFYQAMKRKGYKAVSRRVLDQGYGIYRIWRIE